jgi:hypothetical protein
VTTVRPNIALLAAPYPYRCMLAICSDLDETVSGDVYFHTMDYLNSSRMTPFGQGLGLETGNSMYFYMPPEQFAYWNTGDEERATVRELMQSGHIDCFHSFGDLAVDRAEIESTLNHLDSHGCKMRTWIDHAVAPSNFGGDIMNGYGDVASSAVYHADLTLSFGVEYVWIGRVTSMQGQDAPVSLAGIWKGSRPLKSLETVAKECIKVGFGSLGNRKYAFHSRNRLLRENRLRDGQPVLEFMRCNPHPGGVSFGDNSAGLGDALTDDFLDRLTKRRAKAIVYTHLGKKIDEKKGFAEGTRHALEKLADRAQRNEILVSTGTRMLDFAKLLRCASWSSRQVGETCEISVELNAALPSYAGLSFECDSMPRISLLIDGQPVAAEHHKEVSEGRDVVCVPWVGLDYPR